MTFCKKVVVSDMQSATTWLRFLKEGQQNELDLTFFRMNKSQGKRCDACQKAKISFKTMGFEAERSCDKMSEK